MLASSDDPGSPYLSSQESPSLCTASAVPFRTFQGAHFSCSSIETNEAFALLHFHTASQNTSTTASILALIQSLADVRSTRPLLIMVPAPEAKHSIHPADPEDLALIMRHCAAVSTLASSGFSCAVLHVDPIDPPFRPTERQRSSTRPDLTGRVLAKLHAFRLNCSTIVLLDADQILARHRAIPDCVPSPHTLTPVAPTDPRALRSLNKGTQRPALTRTRPHERHMSIVSSDELIAPLSASCTHIAPLHRTITLHLMPSSLPWNAIAPQSLSSLASGT